MSEPIFSLWVYLAATPLAGLTLTLVAYLAGFAIYERARFHPLANPVPIAVAIVVAALATTGTDYRTYFDGAQFVHFLLGPAVVGLAVPLVREWARVRRLALPIAGALLAGSAVAALSAVGIAWALGASPDTLASIAPKSVTAPIAMGIADTIGGLPALAAVFAVTTGVLGAVTGKYVLDACGVTGWPARGFALGLAAHGIGTARAFQVSEEAGTFAGIAMGLNGVLIELVFVILLLIF
jgi:predicted murein hydrolase (TIGR00659 family)